MSSKQGKNKTAETEETGTEQTGTETPPADETAGTEEETAEASVETDGTLPVEEEQPSEGFPIQAAEPSIVENNSVENEQLQGEGSENDGCLSADYDRVQGGATCPKCSTPKAKVTTTCPWKEGTRVRYHDCQTCGSRIKSIERDVPENLFAVAGGQETATEAPLPEPEERRGFRSNSFHPLARG